VSEEQSPTRNTDDNQDARRKGENGLHTTMPVATLKFGKVAVAGAAGREMIEPLFRFGKRHLTKGDSLENIRAGASGTVRIRELLEQSTAQRIQDAPFISIGICLAVQTCLPLQTLSPFSEKIHLVALTQIPLTFPS
jgi:hypothetical protein